MGIRQLGNKVIRYANDGARLGKKVLGSVSRMGKKHVPLAKAVLGLAGELGGDNKYIGRAVSMGNTAVGGVESASNMADRVLSMGGAQSNGPGMVDEHRRAYHKMVKGGDYTHALNLARDDVKKAGVVRAQVKQHARAALGKAREMRGRGYNQNQSKNKRM